MATVMLQLGANANFTPSTVSQEISMNRSLALGNENTNKIMDVIP